MALGQLAEAALTPDGPSLFRLILSADSNLFRSELSDARLCSDARLRRVLPTGSWPPRLGNL